MATGFPTSDSLAGFTKVKGVPAGGKAYMATAEEAIRRCQDNPFCIGVSNQRLFVVSKLPKKGDLKLEKGQPGESHTYVKNEYM